MITTDPAYPLCSKLGVLRCVSKRGRERLVVSTSALYEALGWKTYRLYLPMMDHRSGNVPGPTPESCEAFLRGLGGKGKKASNG